MTLKKARLIPLGAKNREGKPVEVQFNPTSLSIQYASHTGQKDKEVSLPKQYLGFRSVTLTVDLIFDTADTATDVRRLTGPVLAFFNPPKGKAGGKAGPPRVKFEWGEFFVTGIVNAATEDLDLFTAGGTPLRAKVHMTIEGQDALLRESNRSPADGRPSPETPLGPLQAGPNALTDAGDGGPTPGRADRSGPALDGESAQAFAARAGLDPRAWRSLALGGQDPMSLRPGSQIDFASDTVARHRPTQGFGAVASESLASGVEGLSGATAEAQRVATALGVTAPTASTAGAGGILRSLEQRRLAEGTEIQQRSRADFGLPSLGSGPGTPDRLPVLADRRSLTYGFGIPLRPHFAPSRTADRADRAWVVLSAKQRPRDTASPRNERSE